MSGESQKLAIFDLDGTLFDTSEANYCAYREAIGAFGYSVDPDFFRSSCSGRHYRYFLPLLGITDTLVMEKIHRLKKAAYAQFFDKVRPNVALIDILRNLPDYKKALVTTASRDNTHALLSHFSLYDAFDLILTQEDVKRQKPDPEGFLTAMAHYNVAPNNTVVFEDSDVGVLAAKAVKASIFCIKTF